LWLIQREQATAKAKYGGSLHYGGKCAAFGRDDGAFWVGLENRQQRKQALRDDKQNTSNGNGNGNCKNPPGREFYIPTHRDETAMNGAPDRLWLIQRE
jgi:hypothetical protein